MPAGYYISDSSKGSIMKSLAGGSPIPTKEQVSSLPSVRDKFFEIVPAEVVDVQLTDSRGKIRIKKLVGENGVFDAYPISSNFRKLPMIGEIVLVSEYLPAELGTTSKLSKFKIDNESSYTNLFYHDILNTNNSVVINKNYEYLTELDKSELDKKEVMSSGGKRNLKGVFISDYFIDTNSKNLIPLEGDVLFEGRSGQSIRFSQSVRKDIEFIKSKDLFGSSTKSELMKRKNDVWIYGNDGGKPIIILSNGRELTDKFDTVDSLEDINKDDSSIYLSSDNILPLLTSAVVSTELKNNNRDVKEFYGKQIILNSDRIVLNTKQNELMLFSKKYISLASSNEIFNKATRFAVDAPIVELGNLAKKEGSPVARANELINVLKKLIKHIQSEVMMTNPASVAIFESVVAELDGIKSNTTYTT